MGLGHLLRHVQCAAGRAGAALGGSPVAIDRAATAAGAASVASVAVASQQWQSARAYGKSPSEAGGPPKGYSSFKRRFKMTGSGAIRAMSPGFVHKRFNKSNTRLNRLAQGILVPPSYEKMMKQLGFTSRKF
jgi:ribosomal protein L35